MRKVKVNPSCEANVDKKRKEVSTELELEKQSTFEFYYIATSSSNP